MNSLEILVLSSLIASLKIIQSKVKALSAGQHFLHYNYMGKIFHRSVASNSVVKSPIWSEMNRIRDFMAVLPANLTTIRSKMKSLSSGQHFPHYKSMGAIGCLGNRNFDLICAKTLCRLTPTPVMLHIKIRIGLLASEILKFESVERTTDD